MSKGPQGHPNWLCLPEICPELQSVSKRWGSDPPTHHRELSEVVRNKTSLLFDLKVEPHKPPSIKKSQPQHPLNANVLQTESLLGMNNTNGKPHLLHRGKAKVLRHRWQKIQLLVKFQKPLWPMSGVCVSLLQVGGKDIHDPDLCDTEGIFCNKAKCMAVHAINTVSKASELINYLKEIYITFPFRNLKYTRLNNLKCKSNPHWSHRSASYSSKVLWACAQVCGWCVPLLALLILHKVKTHFTHLVLILLRMVDLDVFAGSLYVPWFS